MAGDFRRYLHPGADPAGTAGFFELDLHRLLAEPPPEPAWLWEGFIERGEVVWIAGPGKAGKSMVALCLSAHLLNRRHSFLGRGLPDGGARVAYIDCENGLRTIHHRLQLAGINAPDGFLYAVARGADLGSLPGLAQLEAYCRAADLVVLDSLIGLHRVDEDKASEVRRLVSGIREAAERHGTAVIGLAHENRQGNLRGSLDWRNAADTVLELRKDDRGWRTVSVADRRNGAEGDPVTFRFRGGLSGELEIETTGGLSPGLSAVEVMAERITELLAVNPGISQSEAARRLDVKRDTWTFRNGWAVARAAGGSSPGGLGCPPMGAAHPAHPAQEEA